MEETLYDEVTPEQLNEREWTLLTVMCNFHNQSKESELKDFVLQHRQSICSSSQLLAAYITCEDVIFSEKQYAYNKNYYHKMSDCLKKVDKSILDDQRISVRLRLQFFLDQIELSHHDACS